jgi:hypothetical protein
MPSTMMNRFWFHPGANNYSYDEGIVRIDECRVILLTEAEHLTRSNQITASGRIDPLAEKFCEQFSSRYGEIAEAEPIYYELEGLFRFVALARIMKHMQVREAVDLDYLIDGFQVPRTRVPDTLAGISHVKEFEHRRELQNGYEIFQLWLPSCGGVSISITMEEAELSRDSHLGAVREKLLSARPSSDALVWEVSP